VPFILQAYNNINVIESHNERRYTDMINKENRKIRIAVVGLRFGGAFVPIYRAHLDVECVAICDTNKERLEQYGDKFGFQRRYTDLEDIFRTDEYDAVHLVTPIQAHAKQTIDVLNSGKHCACTVPMATTIEELKRLQFHL
jgi:predicted dehydrogenase